MSINRGSSYAKHERGDSNTSNQDHLFAQFISEEMTYGQTISSGQTIKFQFQAWENGSTCNLFMSYGLYVIASDGVTIRTTLTLSDVVRDNTELNIGDAYKNRAFSFITDHSYVTQTGDRLVSEIGFGGDPSSGGSHSGGIAFKNNSATDLPEDDTDMPPGNIPDKNCWMELADTLAFVSAASGNRRRRSIICGASA